MGQLNTKSSGLHWLLDGTLAVISDQGLLYVVLDVFFIYLRAHLINLLRISAFEY